MVFLLYDYTCGFNWSLPFLTKGRVAGKLNKGLLNFVVL
jgi:hypothetical protein